LGYLYHGSKYKSLYHFQGLRIDGVRETYWTEGGLMVGAAPDGEPLQEEVFRKKNQAIQNLKL
jgi:hypothetical protein